MDRPKAASYVTITNPWTNRVDVIPFSAKRKHLEVVRGVAIPLGACMYCLELGHIKRDCPQQLRDRPEADRRGLCRLCHEPGHFERECSRRAPGAPTTSPVSYERRPGASDASDRW